MKVLLFFCGLIACLSNSLQAISADKLSKTIETTPNPFNYDLHLQVIPGATQNEAVLIGFHGMGSNYNLARVLKSNPALPYHIVSFNFPDYGNRYTQADFLKTSFGTIDEILPALYVWKNVVVDGGADTVHLYGFSAGGGVVINALAVLNSHRYDADLKKIGINEAEKKQLLQSVQKGSIILEVPLKSFDEIADLFGDARFYTIAKRAHENGLNPLDNLSELHDLSLHVIVYFANPDEALGNRDDQKYIQALRQANSQGKTVAIIGKTGGHVAYHPELWEAVKNN